MGRTKSPRTVLVESTRANKQAGRVAGEREGKEGSSTGGDGLVAGEGADDGEGGGRCTVDPGRAEGGRLERDRTSARKRDGATRRAARQRRAARGNVGQEGPHGRQAIHRHSRACGERRTREGKNPVLPRWRRWKRRGEREKEKERCE